MVIQPIKLLYCDKKGTHEDCGRAYGWCLAYMFSQLLPGLFSISNEHGSNPLVALVLVTIAQTLLIGLLRPWVRRTAAKDGGGDWSVPASGQGHARPRLSPHRRGDAWRGGHEDGRTQDRERGCDADGPEPAPSSFTNLCPQSRRS